MNSGTDRWHFGTHTGNLYITQAIYPTSGTNDADFTVTVNGVQVLQVHALVNPLYTMCLMLHFYTLEKCGWHPGNNLFRFGSGSANCGPSRNYNFEFSLYDACQQETDDGLYGFHPVGIMW